MRSKAGDFIHLEDIGWDHEENRHFYRVFHQPEFRTQASICLSEQQDMAFHGLTITSRTKGWPRAHNVELPVFLRPEIAAASFNESIPQPGAVRRSHGLCAW